MLRKYSYHYMYVCKVTNVCSFFVDRDDQTVLTFLFAFLNYQAFFFVLSTQSLLKFSYNEKYKRYLFNLKLVTFSLFGIRELFLIVLLKFSKYTKVLRGICIIFFSVARFVLYELPSFQPKKLYYTMQHEFQSGLVMTFLYSLTP